LNQGGFGIVVVADDPDINDLIAIKIIGNVLLEETKKETKTIERERSVGFDLAGESKHLVEYFELFKWKRYVCIKMEYFYLGDLQNQLEKKTFFSEEVFLFVFLFFIF
jgi:serine/threonine protein kinase